MPEDRIHFLFRFRDLVAPTIPLHREIIAARSSCWWGWWKRPSEDHRPDIWRALAEAARLARVPVGLFDSGDGKVYRAWVTEVVVPVDSANSPPELPDGERQLVPEYYRKSPFSRAWMRLDSIEDPIDFFGAYSFAEAPRLPNYDARTLARLKGKVIVEGQELRGMDTTIWEVRPRSVGDPDEKILLTTPRLPGSVTTEVVRCESDLVLHLTDPHFAIGNKRNQHHWRLEGEGEQANSTLTEALSLSIGKRKVGLVVITGDLTFSGTEDEFQAANKSLTLLLGNLDLGRDHVVIVPGNHDIRWSTDEVYTEGAEVNRAPAAARANYISFYRRFFGHEANKYLSMGRRYLMSCGLGLEICALNSSSLEQGKNFLAGMGRVEEASFKDTANQFGWAERTLALRVLALHHHLALTEDLEDASGYSKGFGIAIDAVRVQRIAAKHGVQLVLHGHKHRAFVWRSTVYELPEFQQPEHRLGELSIIGGGSAGSTDTPTNANFFNLLHLGTEGLTLEIWRAQYGATFGLMQKWKAGLAIDGKGLRLGEWQSTQG